MSEWRTTPLTDCASRETNSFVDGPFGSDLKVSDYTEAGVRILQLQNLGDGVFIDENIIYTSERKAASLLRCGVRPGDLIIAKMADPLARAAIVPAHVERALIVADLIKLRPAEGIDRDFLCAAINAPGFRREAERLSTGTTRTRISLSTLKRLPVPRPSPTEQGKIGDVIRALDEATEHTEALIAKTQQIKAGLMHDLFTRGVTPDGQLRPPREEAPKLYRESPIGWIPKKWDVVRCGDFFDVQLGKMMSPAASAGPNQRAYLRNQNVYWDYLDLSDVATMHFSRDDMLKYRLRRGDLLACEGRFIGRCAIWRDDLDECYYQKALHRLRALDDRTTTEYMAFFMSLQFELDRGFVEKMTHESTIPHLPLEKLIALPTLMPPREEQDLIVHSLQDLATRERSDQEYLRKSNHLKVALMHDLLTGRVRVSINEPKGVAV